MSKHSPGPWKWDDTGADDVICSAGHGVLVERVGAMDADLLLIAAAPEMLALLRKAEWLGLLRDGAPTCPWCAGSHPSAGQAVMSGHAPRCTFVELIARIEGP
jgi:hypothetical protein